MTCEDVPGWLNRPEIGQIGEFSSRLVHFSGFVGSTCTDPVVVHAEHEPPRGLVAGSPGECLVNRAGAMLDPGSVRSEQAGTVTAPIKRNPTSRRTWWPFPS